jgi:hypothetical protein
LLKTRIGRYLLAGLVILGIVTIGPKFLPQVTTDPNRTHRPPTSVHDGEVITLTVLYTTKTVPSEIHWAIGHAVQLVPVYLIPATPPTFSQSMTYDPSKRYEIWADGVRPLGCTIVIDKVPVDYDNIPQRARGSGAVAGNVHCWVNPL